MPTLSPDARHVLAGVGDGRVYIDGVIPPALANLHAGGWCWQDGDRIVGNGSEDNQSWWLWSYTLSSQKLEKVLGFQGVAGRPCPGASASYGGGGNWGCYLASRPLVSYDNTGRWWNDRVAKGCSPTGTRIFTSPENNALFVENQPPIAGAFQTVQIGHADVVLWWDGSRLQAINATAPLAPPSGGTGARFTNGWLCQWNTGLDQLVVYPWQTSGVLKGYALSGDAKDFNHDIGIRDDGMVIVATGINQGETSCRYYELDLATQQFRVNGAAWKPLTLVNMGRTEPPVPPTSGDEPPTLPITTFPNYRVPSIPAVGRQLLVMPFFATDLRNGEFAAPGNRQIIVNGTVLAGNDLMNVPVFVDLKSSGNPWEKMAGMYGGSNTDTLDNAGLKCAFSWLKKKNTSALLLRYCDTPEMPQDFVSQCELDTVVLVQCYPLPGETVSVSMTRFRASVKRVTDAGRKVGIVRAMNSKFGGNGSFAEQVATVLAIQEPLCTLVRETPACLVDAYFSYGRWKKIDGKIVDCGAAYCAEFQAWTKKLASLAS